MVAATPRTQKGRAGRLVAYCRRVAACLGALGLAAGMTSVPHMAGAGDRIYWSNAGGPDGKISFANLDGSGGGDLNTSGAAPECCAGGAAIDLATQRIFWGNDGANTISFARLDGSGGDDIDTAGATVDGPYGVVVDPVARRIYWANRSSLAFADLDGGGGGNLDTTGATVNGPQGVTIDALASRLYWTNAGSGVAPISFLDLDAGTGGDIDATGAMVNRAQGVAIDPVARKIYWTDFGLHKIFFASLDGGGGGEVVVTGATVNAPYGAAIDPAAQRIYWPNYGGDTIAFADLDGGVGADLATPGATVSAPNFAALLQSPRIVAAPTVTGGTEPLTTLSCSDEWASDLPGAFLYRSPTSVAYQWSLDGTDVGGATARTVEASVAGAYRCRVTAANPAGTASQTSEPHDVTVPAKTCIVPRVVGMLTADAKAAAKKNHCRSKARRAFSTEVAEGHVVSQKPDAGTRRRKGARVRLVVSRGPRP